ncbi:VOC family protein [Rhodanobacter ginsengisoli]|uniref:VOC family protein n=1 Tax=Rhodanobacter ginsengisoli TaxID=418646 RepID=A0ABW0QNV3_9GAMM
MRLNSYLIFDGKAEAAFNFYAQALHGKIAMLMRFGEAPGAGNTPAETRDWIMHVRLEVGDQVLMASDCPPDRPYHGIHGCSVSIAVDTVAEGERIFKALAEGGTIQMPFEQTFWAERFGMVVDRFGVSWMVNCEKGQ